MTALVRQLARFVLVSRDAPALARFYAEAFGATFSEGAEGDAELTLGPSRLTIEHKPNAAPYPANVPGWHPLFQHLAIVVDDMAAAYTHLCRCPGWSPISVHGPVTLPAQSGGVAAFKFRDPEGHPLEFLSFPAVRMPNIWSNQHVAGPCFGIDHSAISVADTGQSVAFYEQLGLAVTSRSLNEGVEQAQLDAVESPIVEVTGLAPASSTPHLELLSYRGDYPRGAGGPPVDGVAATRLVWQAGDHSALAAIAQTDNIVSQVDDAVSLRDPDGHLMDLVLED